MVLYETLRTILKKFLHKGIPKILLALMYMFITSYALDNSLDYIEGKELVLVIINLMILIIIFRIVSYRIFIRFIPLYFLRVVNWLLLFSTACCILRGAWWILMVPEF